MKSNWTRTIAALVLLLALAPVGRRAVSGFGERMERMRRRVWRIPSNPFRESVDSCPLTGGV